MATFNSIIVNQSLTLMLFAFSNAFYNSAFIFCENKVIGMVVDVGLLGCNAMWTW
jgi:hypothetical protein